MKKIEQDSSRTLYVGGIYEVDKNAGGSVTGTKTYYPAAGAMRIDSTLYYVLKDHASTWLSTSLGSASVVTDADGVIMSQNRYYPFGETRFTTGTMFTDKLFTGQRQIAELGIYHYNARFYSPKLGRFLSADTIVPGYANPQNLNRFSYVINNPLKYTDPTGHMMWEGEGGGDSTTYVYTPNNNNNDEDNGGDKPQPSDLLDRRHGCLVGCHWPGPNEASYEALTNFFDVDNIVRDVWDTLNSPLSGLPVGNVLCSRGNCDPKVAEGVIDVVSRVPGFIKFIAEGYNPPPTKQPTPFLSPTVVPTATLSTPTITATPTITLTPTFTVTPSLAPTFPTLTLTSASTPVYWVP